MRPSLIKRWLLPLSILTTSALATLGVIVFELNFANRSSAEVARQPAGETAGGCSGALSSDYACYQERYQNLVHYSGVEAAFAELEEDYEDNGFVKASCHQLTHVIGCAAADLYGDVSGAFGRGEHFCGTGYYHGVMEAVVARTGPTRFSTRSTLSAPTWADTKNTQLTITAASTGSGTPSWGFTRMSYSTRSKRATR